MTLRLITASAVAAVMLSGCAVSIGPSNTPVAPAPADPASPASPAQPASPVPSQSATAASPTAERTWAYSLVESATRPAEATSATIKGTRDTFPNSTSLWVGCDGLTDEVTLATNGKYTRLYGRLGLRDSTPDGLVVHVLILVDGQPVQNAQLDAADPRTLEVNVMLKGVRQVTFQSQAVTGECSSSEESYAVLGDGYVE